MKRNEDQDKISANFRRAKVLVVEDNDDQWTMMKYASTQVMPEITMVRLTTIEQALNLLIEWRHQEWEIPKLILLDLYLPANDDGWEFLKQLKEMPAPVNHIPVVILSSSGSSTDITQSYDLGVSSYLVKPIDYEGWLTYFRELRLYWWETVTLPPIQYRF